MDPIKKGIFEPRKKKKKMRSFPVKIDGVAAEIQAFTHTRTHTNTYTHARTHTHALTHTHTHIHTHAHIHIHTDIF